MLDDLLHNEYDFSSIDFDEFAEYDAGSRNEMELRAKGAVIYDSMLTYLEDAVRTGDAGPTFMDIVVELVALTKHHKGFLPTLAMLDAMNYLAEAIQQEENN